MIKFLKRLLNPPEQFVLTSNGNVGRLERINHNVNSCVISFGAFDIEGKWKPSKETTISVVNITEYLTKKECAEKISDRYKNYNNNGLH